MPRVLISQAGDTGVATRTPATPTPTPIPVTVAQETGSDPVDAQSALIASGLVVQVSTSDGRATPTDWTGWTVTSQSPAAGAVVPPGTVVTLIATPPAPTPAAPVQQAPAAPGHPAGATALCNDGTFSYSAHHQGSCSHHGGVAQFFD